MCINTYKPCVPICMGSKTQTHESILSCYALTESLSGWLLTVALATRLSRKRISSSLLDVS